MYKDVESYCRSCHTCQVKSKQGPKKAPLVQPAVLTEPFECAAVDIVGPLPKGKGGCRYILTYVCLASRWPDAVPLRSVTAKAVADALWQIFDKVAVLSGTEPFTV